MGDPDTTKARRTDTDDPRRSRERALKILFQADVRQVTPQTTLQRLADDPDAQAMLDEVDDLADDRELLPPIAYEPGVEVERVPDDPATSRSQGSGRGRARPPSGGGRGADGGAVEIDEFTRSLVLGVHDNRERIDGLIGRFARRWQVSRMPVVDRTVLRLATYELLYEITAPAIVIHEAVHLAKELSTDDSGRYVNGVLESVRQHLASGEGDIEATTDDVADPEVVGSEAADPEAVRPEAVGPEPVGPEAAGHDVGDAENGGGRETDVSDEGPVGPTTRQNERDEPT